ncbi:MAG: PaaI family thioesterase [Tissierellia bacterium]|nr:PaaI family thioesterase [Tissierellia bacterium]
MDFNKKLRKYIEAHLRPLELDGIKLVEVSKGHAVIELEVTEKLFNAYGIVHGGILFTLCDTCAGITGSTLGEKSVTLQSGINYIKSTSKGKLKAVSEVLHKGRSTIVVNVKLFDSYDILLADANFTMYIIKHLNEGDN